MKRYIRISTFLALVLAAGWLVAAPGAKAESPAWAQEAYIKASNNEKMDYFGCSVAIDGDTLVIGAVGEDSGQTTVTKGPPPAEEDSGAGSGAVYVFRRASGAWELEAYLKAPIDAFNYFFGEKVAIDGDTIIVSAPGDESNQTTITNGAGASTDCSSYQSGAVYVFRRADGTWAQEAYIKAANNDPDDSFGCAIDVSGDTIAVGAYDESSSQSSITNGIGASSDNSASSSGAVYVYRRANGAWAQEAFIKADNCGDYDQFGFSVALDGDTLVVGANKEDAMMSKVRNGAGSANDNLRRDAGAAYVYRRTGKTWAQEAYLKPGNTAREAEFGRAVAISGDTVAVSAPFESSNNKGVWDDDSIIGDSDAPKSGAVYIFQRTNGAWTREAYVKAPNCGAGDNFGRSIALSGNTLAVGALHEGSSQATITNGEGAPDDDSCESSGAVYVYARQERTWSQRAFLKASNNKRLLWFGEPVGVSGTAIVVGVSNDSSGQSVITNGADAPSDDSSYYSGAAFVFRLK